MTREEAETKARERWGQAAELIEDFQPPPAAPAWTAAPVGSLAVRLRVGTWANGAPVYLVPACGATWEGLFANADTAARFAVLVKQEIAKRELERRAAEEGGSLN